MCGYDGEDFDDLMQHVLTHAISPSSEPLKKPDSKPRKRRRLGPVQRMVCIFCKERFQKRAAYHAHLPTHCGADGCYQCPECERKYPLLTKLRVHIDSTHRNIYPVTCKECGKVCGSPRKLRSHMWVHSNNYRYSCDHCGKKFKQLAETRNHIDELHLGIKKKKTNKRKGKAYEPAKYNDCPYKCETCLCGYIERGRWVQHVRNKHPEIDITTLPP
ncbi:PR domain zinc finger protein 10-like [Paramacrobiotus metropolitanus]|uniref:PR domain zinc finger protein 10-like n=1 Tax=Paramacrobiotus metropolitanus TaxID=2943436 RepID=UPI0024461FFB|nr:PR domain zinc finger protein 10-like [Paramacrobiotus metropolitanus]